MKIVKILALVAFVIYLGSESVGIVGFLAFIIGLGYLFPWVDGYDEK
ncbi:hypothetical protein [Lysinibacillus sp. Bpr_S20]|nr:hypothetical protein [Lysinibacillus sp. Bpr_S20]MCL1700742.1 hypothetical protein [Lysinibacillus sp. Bpr_S20]